VVTPDVTTATNRKTIIGGAAQYKIPAICPASYYADEGALIAYGIDYVDQYRRAAGYADRILRGARPGDLPVQAPSKFEMVINLRAAKALGIDVPDGVLLRADRVIGR
jgi:putative ABC transport system substrate-binding protein